MWKLFGNKKPKDCKQRDYRSVRLSKRGRIIYFSLIAIGVFFITAAGQSLLTIGKEYATAREEYERLSELFGATITEVVRETQPFAHQTEHEPTFSDTTKLLPQVKDLPDIFSEMLALNPDFIGWISIDDLIDYPVVQGEDNTYYMQRTFAGELNPAGAIFMDSRLADGFASPVFILYGHNAKDGTMFAPLQKYQDLAFLENSPNIYIMTLEYEVLVYRAFAAKLTDAWDEIYDLEYQSANEAVAGLFNSPPEAVAELSAAHSDVVAELSNTPSEINQLLVLSTCTNSPDKYERLLVYAALISAS